MTTIDTTDVYDRIRATRGATKHCSACNDEHPIEAFAFKQAALLKLHSRCRDSQRTTSRNHYDANKDAHKARVAERRRRIVDEVNDLVDSWLNGRSCAGCGDAAAVAVGADGVNIRRQVKSGWNVEDVRRALEHATPLCRSQNCR